MSLLCMASNATTFNRINAVNWLIKEHPILDSYDSLQIKQLCAEISARFNVSMRTVPDYILTALAKIKLIDEADKKIMKEYELKKELKDEKAELDRIFMEKPHEPSV